MLDKITHKCFQMTPVKSDHFETLYDWVKNQDFLRYCSHKNNFSNKEEFIEDLLNSFRRRDRFCQFILEKNSQIFGTIFAYSLNKEHGYCFITIFLNKNTRNMMYGPYSVYLFCSFLFKELKLFKIYMDVYGNNSTCIHILKKAKISEEGVFIGHRIFNGERVDLYRFALYKKNLENFLNKKTAL